MEATAESKLNLVQRRVSSATRAITLLTFSLLMFEEVRLPLIEQILTLLQVKVAMVASPSTEKSTSHLVHHLAATAVAVETFSFFQHLTCRPYLPFPVLFEANQAVMVREPGNMERMALH